MIQIWTFPADPSTERVPSLAERVAYLRYPINLRLFNWRVPALVFKHLILWNVKVNSFEEKRVKHLFDRCQTIFHIRHHLCRGKMIQWCFTFDNFIWRWIRLEKNMLNKQTFTSDTTIMHCRGWWLHIIHSRKKVGSRDPGSHDFFSKIRKNTKN